MSSSTSSSGTTSSTNLASLYECPVCFEYISPPIFQCSNGHMVCSNCSPKLDRCPSCQGPIGTCRNLFMEETLSLIHFPCKFYAQGCQVNMLLAEKSTHEENCLFRPITYSCPYSQPLCKWKGAMDQIVPHCSEHSWIKLVQGDEFLFKIEVGFFLRSKANNRHRRWGRVQNCHDHYFVFTVTKEGKKSDDGHDYDRISAALQFIGSKIEASNFSYSLKLTGHRHQLMWKGTPLSINENFHSAAQSNEYLVIESTDLGQKFSQNGFLDFEVKIERYSE